MLFGCKRFLWVCRQEYYGLPVKFLDISQWEGSKIFNIIFNHDFSIFKLVDNLFKHIMVSLRKMSDILEIRFVRRP